MSTPLYHPLRQAIAAMARTTDALVELARRIDETGLGPANEGRGIGDATPIWTVDTTGRYCVKCLARDSTATKKVTHE